ncbi:unnamed protein product [Microthlaspi erraticum]|uniref:Reverse transcriptase domain-containing protein n=1 Tax=Microthlaspi erraticum TaxID=1685480 RepID=A0A6D2HL57_9BRAS|nr:unnamed protein product [Microthlaspi erraticum]
MKTGQRQSVSRASSTSTNAKEENSETIPTDLMIEISLRLPRKSIARCRCVSKLWNSTLDSPYFIEFLTRPRFLFSFQKDSELCFLSSPQDENSSLVDADYHLKLKLEDSFKVCGHVRGLVCLHDLWGIKGKKETAPVICNPRTGQLLPLPKVKTKRSIPVKSFFGFDPTDKEFKVLTITDGVQHRVLTLGTRKLEWRMVECGIPRHYPTRDGICINGGLYYLAGFQGPGHVPFRAIVCFDVRLEKHRVINAAEGMDLDQGTLVNYKGKIGVLASDDVSWIDRLTGESRHIVLWVLVDTETHEWSKHVYELPQPLWKNVVALYFVGVTGGTDEVVLWPRSVCAPFYVYYYNMERNTLRRVVIKGMDAAVRYYGGCMTLDYVEDLKLMRHDATILTLVPKFPGASRISDYRPISCLNTWYKVVSRLLVSRLKPILSDLILPSQTAFVKDRLLVENTVLAGELVNGYHKSKGPKRITIKVDIAKAFDSVSWDFLFNCLKGLSLPPQYIHSLKLCICTTNFTIGYNGMVQGYFRGKRGLRQGDPLSPYLFVIAMNCLSHMLNKAAEEGKISYHHQCRASKLTHLCFADDLLIFVDGSLDSVQKVLQVLHEFHLRSGLAVSVQKSSFFASGMSDHECDLIKFSTGMPQGTLPVTSWSARSLSFAGRLLLIKTVIAGISTFWCSSFILPKACIKRINSLCSIYLWKGNIEGHNSARVSWATVTLTKEEGGLGIKDLVVWNRACCLKLIWLLFFQSGSVWVAWFTKEVLEGNVSNFWIVKTHRDNSWLANKLIKMRDDVYPWIKIKLGDGRATRFWSDNWSPLGNITAYLQGTRNTRLEIPVLATLASLNGNDRWLLPLARSENMVNLQAYLTTVTLSDQEDTYEWEVDGVVLKKYCIGGIYHKLRREQQAVPWSRAVWQNSGIPKHNFLTWLFVLNRCLTRDRILAWGLQTDAKCLLCNSGTESRDHLYFDCLFSWGIWRHMAKRSNLRPARMWADSLAQMNSLSAGKHWNKLTLLAWQASIYWIWHERNGRLHRQIFNSGESIHGLIDRQIRNRIASYRDVNTKMASKLLQLWLSTESVG